jgi:hypothetical protein
MKTLSRDRVEVHSDKTSLERPPITREPEAPDVDPDRTCLLTTLKNLFWNLGSQPLKLIYTKSSF